jgi:hypothetical protein
LKSSYINNRRYFCIKAAISIALVLVTTVFLTVNAFAAMGLPGRNGVGIEGGMDNGKGNNVESNRGTRMGEGLDNNLPENGVPTPSDTNQGNLGDTDGDGVVEDKGTGDGLIGDIVDMGSEIVSDIGDMRSDIISDVSDGIGNGTKAPDTQKTPADSGMANDDGGKAGTIVAVVVAILVAIALVILIIVIIPRDKDKRK